MTLIWRRDALLSLLEPATTSTASPYHNRRNQTKDMDITEEHTLPSLLLRLSGSTVSAPHEFQLKGSFPEKDYQDIIVQLLSQYKSFPSAISLSLQAVPTKYTAGNDSSTRFSGVHCASFFGIVELVASLVDVQG